MGTEHTFDLEVSRIKRRVARNVCCPRRYTVYMSRTDGSCRTIAAWQIIRRDNVCGALTGASSA